MIKPKYKYTKTKARAKGRAILAARLSGDEPIVTKENYQNDLGRALMWYQNNWNDKQIVAAAQDYLKTSGMKQYAYCVNKAYIGEIRQVATIGRLILRGQYVELDHVEKIFIRLADLRETYPKPVAKVAGPVISIQDRMLAQARTIAGEFDAVIDAFVENNYHVELDFDALGMLRGTEVSGPVAKKVAEIYAPLLAELNEAIEGTDDQLVEGWPAMIGKRETKRYRDLIESIISACNQHAVSARGARKPRAKKVKPPAVVVAKIKYLKEFPDLNLTSVSPTKIIGADELWLYVPEKRKLIVYYGAGEPLGVKGTTVLNYDVNNSAVKTVRNPEAFFKTLSSTGKRAMANAWKSLKAKSSKPRSRINETMLILAAN